MPVFGKQIVHFVESLHQQECADGTIELYTRAVKEFACWLGEQELETQSLGRWKGELQSKNLQPSTINTKLAAINKFLDVMGRKDCQTKLLRLQKKPFRDPGRELTRANYNDLLAAARRTRQFRLLLLMETIGSTGLRVSEVQYVTVQAVKRRRVDINLKGKIRTILMPSKLCKKLLRYIDQQHIASGAVFCTAQGKALSRKRIWAEMKKLCAIAGVEARRVFPHNLRHLFATTFYRAFHDIVRLADLLGHSNLETTRIYLATSGEEHIRQLERLNLVI